MVLRGARYFHQEAGIGISVEGLFEKTLNHQVFSYLRRWDAHDEPRRRGNHILGHKNAVV